MATRDESDSSMKVAVVSANLGAYDQEAAWPALGPDVDVVRLTDRNFPPRPLAMTSRLQCGIPKWFGWQFAPCAEVLIWIDASCAPTERAVSWFLARLGTADLAVFRHPERATIQDEYDFMVDRLQRRGETYLTSRYKGEWLDAQYDLIYRAQAHRLPLYASTAFAYRPRARVQAALAEVFTMKARYLLHDQLALPYVLDKHECLVNVIPDNYLKCEALQFVRKRRAA